MLSPADYTFLAEHGDDLLAMLENPEAFDPETWDDFRRGLLRELEACREKYRKEQSCLHQSKPQPERAA